MKKKKPISKEKHKFEEERAREILAYVFPAKYTKSVLQESPDIYVPDLGIGIEVTDGIKTSIQENLSWVSDITGKTTEELSYWNIQHIQKQDVQVSVLPNGQHIASFAFWGNEYDIISAYQNKLDKLNKTHFKRYKENNLFIYVWMIEEDDIEHEITELVQQIQNDNEFFICKFDYVYIFSGKNLFSITVKNKSVEKFPISSDVMNQISNGSFEKVLGMPRDQYYRNNRM